MDQIVTIAIILLLLAIIIGSLRRGLQSLISFALLGLLVTLLVARLPGRGMSFAFGIFGGNNSSDETTSVEAIKAFDQFSQATRSFVPDLISSGLGSNNGSLPSDTTDVTPIAPSTDNSNSSGNTNTGNTNTGNTNTGNTSGTGSNNTGNGSGTANSEDSGSNGSVRAWW